MRRPLQRAALCTLAVPGCFIIDHACEVAEVAGWGQGWGSPFCPIFVLRVSRDFDRDIARSMQLMRVASDLTQTFRPCLTP